MAGLRSLHRTVGLALDEAHVELARRHERNTVEARIAIELEKPPAPRWSSWDSEELFEFGPRRRAPQAARRTALLRASAPEFEPASQSAT